MDNIQSFTSPRKSSKALHSHRMSERKRNLFGTDKELIDKDNDDLGPIKLISDIQDLKYLDENFSTSNSIKQNITDMENIDNFIHCRGKENISANVGRNMSPLYISPASSTRQSMNFTPSSTISADSPVKCSPTQALKTPHDTLNLTTSVPRQPRKSITESSTKPSQSLKRKSVSPSNSPEAKQSKARTALFPAHTFYPKAEETNKREKLQYIEDISKVNVKKQKPKSSALYLCNRKLVKSRNRFGQINAGVRHKIRKPKQKKINKSQLLKVAMKIIENSPLNEYLGNSPLKLNKNVISKEQVSKMDEILKNIDKSSSSFVNELVPITVNTTNAAPIEEQKRKRSPSPDLNKKFFKHSHTRATFTMSNNVKLAVDNGKMTILEAQRKKRRMMDYTESFDIEKEEIRVEETEIANVLSLLDKDEDLSTKIVLTASTTVSGSENSIHIHESVDEIKATPTVDPNVLLSPTSQMCDMTSGLALNSPSKSQVVKNLSDNLNMCSGAQLSTSFTPFLTSDLNSGNSMAEANKWYPIFYAGTNHGATDAKDCSGNNGEKNKGEMKLVNKYFKNVPKHQMFLDVGQKKLDLKQCPECNIVYNMGEPEDENMHLKHHHAVNVLRFNGWKNERVVTMSPDGKERIIAIYPEDSKVWWKKVNELLHVVNQELGYLESDISSVPFVKLFLYIKNKQIAGCLVAEPKTIAHKMLSVSTGEVEMVSEESYPIKCGVNRIWVAINCRKQGIATRLMNCLRKNFMFGSILSGSDVAVSPPTVEGKAFATKYFNTPNFLIYTQ